MLWNKDSFRLGRHFEDAVARLVRERGGRVLRVGATGGHRAPLLEGDTASEISPDLLHFVNGRTKWIEVKAKTRAAFNRTRGFKVTGFSEQQWVSHVKTRRSQPPGDEFWFVFCHKEEDRVRVQTLDKLASVLIPGNAPMCGEMCVYFPWDSLVDVGSLDLVMSRMTSDALEFVRGYGFDLPHRMFGERV